MIPGIDVSHYQGSIDWAKVKAAGIRFAYVKASQGADFTDPRLFANVAGAAAAGIPIGLYHVFVANLGNAQLSKWQEIYASADSQLPPWIDIEPGAVTEETAPQALEFLRAMKSNSGTKPRNPGKPCVYCSPMTAQSDLSDPEFRTYPLAIAHYTDAPSPNTVLWSGWEFWQHSCSGTVDGILGAVDLDRFNADESDFQKLLDLPVTSPNALKPQFSAKRKTIRPHERSRTYIFEQRTRSVLRRHRAPAPMVGRKENRISATGRASPDIQPGGSGISGNRRPTARQTRGQRLSTRSPLEIDAVRVVGR